MAADDLTAALQRQDDVMMMKLLLWTRDSSPCQQA